jgi:hypothetical protein
VLWGGSEKDARNLSMQFVQGMLEIHLPANTTLSPSSNATLTPALVSIALLLLTISTAAGHHNNVGNAVTNLVRLAHITPCRCLDVWLGANIVPQHITAGKGGQ